MRRTGTLALILAAALAACGKSPSNASANVTLATSIPRSGIVPFVGCPQDGQSGPSPAPSGPPHQTQISADAAQRLAFYSGDGQRGVLAPRGWRCFGVYGSDGAQLYVTPDAIVSVMADTWPAGAGPAIEVAWSAGDTSGRFTVAQAIMRMFPSHSAFAQGVIAEGAEPASQFPAGPFATDKLVRVSDTVVEYETPADAQGVGTTFSRLTASPSGPIGGAAALVGATPNLAFLAIRLTPDTQSLSRPIIQQFEIDSAAASKPAAASAPSAVTDSAPGVDQLDTVRNFYADLSRGDGDAASLLVIPAKRGSGAFSAKALTAFYGSMRQPLALGDAVAGRGVGHVTYTFVDAHGRACNGAADVTLTYVEDQWLIAGVHALNGC